LGRAVDDFLWVKLGTGIGCGIMCGGRIYRGEDGCSGDIGHIAVAGEDVVCPCGNTGCLGWVAGGAALARHMEQAAREGTSAYLARVLEQQGTLRGVDLREALGQGDPVAAQLVRRTGSYVGQVLAVLVNFYNPRLIVLGGGLANLGDLLLAAIREAIYGRSRPLATRHLAIQRSALGDTAGVVGAAALVLGELFRAPHRLSSRSPQVPKRAIAGSARQDAAV
jgi:predicted NBD/HSP70 family sugar kinase